MTCDHKWIEVGNRRWCVRRYDEDGCGTYQRRSGPAAKWVTEYSGRLGKSPSVPSGTAVGR